MTYSEHIWPQVNIDTTDLATEDKQDDIITELETQGDVLDALAVDLAAIEAEQLDQGTSLDAMVTDLAAIEVEILDQGTSLDSIDTKLDSQATSANQTTIIGHVDGIEALLTTIDSVLDNIKTNTDSLDIKEFVRNNYSSTNVTTGAYVELIASTSNTIKKLHIFDSSGETLYLAIGASGSEVDKMIIVPGGNDLIECNIPSGSRISLKAISGNCTVGEIVLNLIG